MNTNISVTFLLALHGNSGIDRVSTNCREFGAGAAARLARDGWKSMREENISPPFGVSALSVTLFFLQKKLDSFRKIYQLSHYKFGIMRTKAGLRRFSEKFDIVNKILLIMKSEIAQVA